jgi:hypothetical protein
MAVAACATDAAPLVALGAGTQRQVACPVYLAGAAPSAGAD